MICVILFLVCLILSILFIFLSNKFLFKSKPILHYFAVGGSVLILFFTMWFLCEPAINMLSTLDKGLEIGKFMKLSYSDLSEIYGLNKIMPKDDSKEILNRDMTNDEIIIFYRYDCPECKESVPLIKNFYQDKKIFWCSTRSTLGEKILDKFGYLNISEVPAKVCYNKNLEEYEAKNLFVDYSNEQATIIEENF